MSTKVNLVPDENGNDPFVQLSGRNVIKASKKIDYVGSYDASNFVFTPGSFTVAAGSFKRFGPINWDGYSNVIGTVRAASTSTSTSWITNINFAATNNTATSGNFNPQPSVNGGNIASAGTQTSTVAPSTIVWPAGFFQATNNDGVNALVIDYAAVTMNV